MKGYVGTIRVRYTQQDVEEEAESTRERIELLSNSSKGVSTHSSILDDSEGLDFIDKFLGAQGFVVCESLEYNCTGHIENEAEKENHEVYVYHIKPCATVLFDVCYNPAHAFINISSFNKEAILSIDSKLRELDSEKRLGKLELKLEE